MQRDARQTKEFRGGGSPNPRTDSKHVNGKSDFE